MSAIMQQFEHSLALPFFGFGVKTDLFKSCGHLKAYNTDIPMWSPIQVLDKQDSS